MSGLEIGSKIKDLRKQLELSQEMLGQQIGMGRGSIYKWEKGISSPNAEQLQLLCKALSCSADELLGLESPDQIEGIGGLRVCIRRPRHGPPQYIEELKMSIEIVRHVMEGENLEQIRRRAELSYLNNNAVIRLLNLALLTKSVELVSVPSSHTLERKLKDKYHLRHCLVAELEELPTNPIVNTTVRKEAVAFLAAQHCPRLIADVNTIGFSGGAPIYRFVEMLRPATPELTGKEYWSLLSTKRQRSIATRGTSANSIVTQILRTQPGANGNLMPYINPIRRSESHYQHASGEEREELEYAHFIKRTAAMVDVAFVTVGTPRADHLAMSAQQGIPEMGRVLNERLSKVEMERCVGDVLLRLLDKVGHRIGSESAQKANDEFVSSVELDDLRKISEREMVWVVAASPEKAAIIRALVVSGMANCLVIDNTIARALLRP